MTYVHTQSEKHSTGILLYMRKLIQHTPSTGVGSTRYDSTPSTLELPGIPYRSRSVVVCIVQEYLVM